RAPCGRLRANRRFGFRDLVVTRAREGCNLVAHNPGYEADVTPVIRRKARVAHSICDAPAPKILHGSDVERLARGELDTAICLVDRQTLHAPPSELDRQDQPNRTGADDKDRYALNGSIRRLSCHQGFWRVIGNSNRWI